MAGAVETHELAWAAGFVDGEGCWYRTRNGKDDTYPRFTIEQVDPYALERFRDAVGVGKIYGPRQVPGRPNSQPSYRLAVYGLEKVQHVTAMLWGFLGPVKRAQANRVLSAGRRN